MKLISLKFVFFGTLLSFGIQSFSANHSIPQFDYDKEWKAVFELEKVGKPRSAIDIVNRIYAHAKTDKNEPQMLKSLEYGIRLNSGFEEGYFEKGIAHINKELPFFNEPSIQVLHSLLADLYTGYYNNNRHLILQRTSVAEYELDDMATWDQRLFAEKIFDELEKSLENSSLLKSTPASAFSAILTEGDSLDIFRPTLFDILAHHALDFFKNDEFMSSRPAVRFEIDDPQMIDIAEAFVKLELKQAEDFSMKFHALELYQELIAFHLDDKAPAALIDADLSRLDFIHNHAIFEEKNRLLLHTLEQMESKYIGYEAVTEVYYHLALLYNNNGSEYRPLISDEHKRDKLVAAQYCENAIKEYPGSYGAKLCKALLRMIREKSLQCQMEYADLPGKHILTSIRFSNVSKLYLRVVPLDPEEDRKEMMGRGSEKKLNDYKNIRPVKQWSVDIPLEVDHNEHRTEIAIPLLPEGYYGLMISDNPSFEKNKGVISISNFWTTNISYIDSELDNGDHMFYVLDRMTGKKMPGVRIQAFEEYYDNRNRQYALRDAGMYTSNDEGSFIISAAKENASRLIFDFRTETDRYISPDYFYIAKPYDHTEKTVRNTHFFTDRAIYRPGQTIFFKGILIESLGEKHEIVKNEKTKVRFYDANHQLVFEQELQTNEYGSFHGSFTAPTGRLTGRMRIQNETGSTNIQVEEYKRPKFELVFDPVKGSYKLGSQVTMTGKAMAYAGSAIDHATVKYRVIRNTYYPYRYSWIGHYPQGSEAEIAYGETNTDSDGSFSIEFTAIPDRTQAMWLNPVFTYKLVVDVTDISGETHSGDKSVSVSNKSLLINLGIEDQVNRETIKEISLETTNLNGEKEASVVDVKIFRLEAPDKILLAREWPRPDVYMIGNEDFTNWFPNLPYHDEDDRMKWEEAKTAYSASINTENDSVLDIKDVRKWETGTYKVVMKAEDVFGEEVEMTKLFTLYSEESKQLPDNIASEFIALDKNVEPGENARFLIGSSFKNVSLLYHLEGKDGTLKHEWINIDNEQRLIEVPVRKEDRGGLGISFVFVNHNESYEYSTQIDVPFSNKELDISFESFRNKLLPGEKERWNIRIRSHKGEKVAAEMLATMYDASLDAFTPHNWWFNIYRSSYYSAGWDADNAFRIGSGISIQEHTDYEYPEERSYDQLAWKNKYSFGWGYGGIRMKRMDGLAMTMTAVDDEAMELEKSEESEEIMSPEDSNVKPPPQPEEQSKTADFPVRKNLQETAFFYPDLRTNEDGDVILSFTIPEALTRWKMLGYAHTQELEYGLISKELVTQKDLMIMPNQPRFFREGDVIWFSAKVSNMSEKELSGTASLQLFDAISMKPVNELFGNDLTKVEFKTKKGNSAYVSWKLNIPENAGPVLYRVMASAGNFSDGEEMVIPVLKNRMLVTESLPLPINGNETRHFVFEKLANSASTTLSNYNYTLEFTSNPAWYAVQALPYLMEYPHECSEQIFNRVYANAFATHIVNQHPKIKTVFERWMNESPDAFLSNLEKNQNLKNALLEETPWVMQAKNESERKKRIALLFDLNKMERDLSTALNKLEQKQLGNGGWPWFDGGQDNRYITQYIISGLGKMSQLGILDRNDTRVIKMVKNGIRYLDERMNEDFTFIKNKQENYRTAKYLNNTHIQYLYARSFFMDEYYLLGKHKEAFLYFKEQAKKYWKESNKYTQGMIALAMNRFGEDPLPKAIMASIKEHALHDDEMGMYWRRDAGYYWYEAPVETQALLIEAFDEIMNDKASVELMKTWLLKQKQTHDWETTRATADACYALLLRGANLIAEEGQVSIEIGGETVDPDQLEGVEKEAGTGYFQHNWAGSEITSDMANITVTKSNEGVAWGAVYWQYFEDLDKITAHASPLSIQKKLFLKTYTEDGPVLTPVNDGDALKPGDKVVSRIEIRVDRDMEFVHMKDMRAAALEPENSMSGYRWQGGMGYYESIRDASVNFFFSYLRKGTWVFEYPLNVTQKGSFSNGISTIQCMYAPEFASHSEGVRIEVE